jgi:hypothetical protein
MVEPAEVADVMRGLDVWWAVAGGWAVDLWLGRRTREHHDVEVSIVRDDQLRLHELAARGWELSCIDPPGRGWRTLRDEEVVDPPSFQLKARNASCEFDLFLETTDDDAWIFRRDRRIRRNLDSVRVATASGIPVVAPEVHFLYAAKHTGAKNEHDFSAALPALGVEATRWLGDCLALVHPDHQWCAALAAL